MMLPPALPVSLIHSSNIHIWSPYNVPGMCLRTEDSTVNKTDQLLPSGSLQSDEFCRVGPSYTLLIAQLDNSD